MPSWKHEFWLNLAILQPHVKILNFLARYPWLFPNTPTLTSWLFLCLLGYFWLFFLRFNPNFCKALPMAVLPTQFPVFWANNSHNSTLVASGCAATISLNSFDALFKWLNLGLPLGLGCKFPSIFCWLTSFWKELLRQANISAVFQIDSFCSRWAATILERKSTEYAFICILFLVNSLVPHNMRKCCIC